MGVTMSKAISFIALSAALLVACSDDAEPEATPTTSAAEPCEGAGVSSDASRPGPKVTPSPYELCEGAYECVYTTHKFWLTFDGKDCKFVSLSYPYEITLYPDGRASDSEKEGRWSGNAVEFTVDFGGELDPTRNAKDIYICVRLTEFNGVHD